MTREIMNEIVSSPLSSGTLNFNLGKLQSNIENKTIDSIQTPDGLVDVKGDNKILTLSIGENLISGITVNINEYPFPALTFIYSNPEYRNKGYMKKVLKEYTKKFGKLMTDNIQTKESESMWKSLIAGKTSELKIEVINTSTDEISKLGDKNYSWSVDPWDDITGEIRLIFESQENKLKSLLESKPNYNFDGILGVYKVDNI